MKNIAVFVSGSGSDMQSIIDNCESGNINGNVVCVVSNKSEIFALERAKKHNIPSKVFEQKTFGDIIERDKAIVEYLAPYNIELIVLAGYLSIVTSVIINKYPNKIINIHPALIPKFCGKGMYGMRVHEAVIAAGEKESGATVHYVDEGADTGKIIAQEKVKILENDSAESLQKRVLELEHKLLPQVVAKLCE
ncbi:MAG: phosphoribosylglycinamide formyltransferase [Clostridia bacterium]